jgi:hypothetical protein
MNVHGRIPLQREDGADSAEEAHARSLKIARGVFGTFMETSGQQPGVSAHRAQIRGYSRFMGFMGFTR